MKARKRFGQHFLEPGWIPRVIDAVGPAPGDVFLEIGPGRGQLTVELARVAERVVAVEIDRDLAASLPSRVPSNVQVLASDFLRLDLSTVTGLPRPFRVAGNLPYNVSTPILFRLLELAEDGLAILDATVMLQREVADRLTARPGTEAWGALSACTQLHTDTRRLLDLPPGAFRPAPKVHSTVLRLTYHPARPAVQNPAFYQTMVVALFTKRRKMLSNAVAGMAADRGQDAGAILEAAALDGRRRPETLSVEELARLSDVLSGS